MASYCAVKDCTNGAYKLKKWFKEHGKGDPVPFKLYPFPTIKKNPEKRNIWIRNINRQEGSKQKCQDPGKDARVWSIHFVDGEPTDANPHPTENLGYDFESRRKRFFHESLAGRTDIKRSRKSSSTITKSSNRIQEPNTPINSSHAEVSTVDIIDPAPSIGTTTSA